MTTRSSSGSFSELAVPCNYLHFVNCRLLSQCRQCSHDNLDVCLAPGSLLVDRIKGVIVAMILEHECYDMNDRIAKLDGPMETMDCRGNILSPGFIDIQLNGAYGVDFSCSNITSDKIQFVASKLPETGVTSFCPTLISCSANEYAKLLPIFRSHCAASEYIGSEISVTGAAILGMHLEGPFFAPSKRGAHPLEHICDPVDRMESVKSVYGTSELGKCGVAMVTLAPERKGALEVLEELAKMGVIVSMGHTEATLESGKAAIGKGATLITHMFNAMLPFHHREPAFFGLLAGCPTTPLQTKPYYSIISDGIHVHPTAISLARSVHPFGAVLITDGISAMGLGGGGHSLGDTYVVVSGMRATVMGTDTLAGSVAPMDFCVQSYKRFTGCSAAEALRAVTLAPAKLLRIDHERGRLQTNSVADLVMLDDDLTVLATWVKGRQLFRH